MIIKSSAAKIEPPDRIGPAEAESKETYFTFKKMITRV